MANAQLDHFSAYFANLGMSVGSGKPNNWDDVLVAAGAYLRIPLAQRPGEIRAAYEEVGGAG